MLGYALPLAAPIVNACLFIAAAQVPFMFREWRVEALFLLAASLVAVNYYAAKRMTGSWHFSVPPIMLAVGGFGYLLLVGNAFGRYLVIAGVVGMLAVFFAFLERKVVSVSQDGTIEVPVEYGRLSLMMIAPATFFLFAFFFALIEHQVSSRWPLMVFTASLSFFLAWEALRKLEIAERPVKRLAGGIAILGLEFFLALSFLPINHLVNAAVLCILLSLFLQRARDALIVDSDAESFRRQVTVSSFLIILILVTAQWL